MNIFSETLKIEISLGKQLHEHIEKKMEESDLHRKHNGFEITHIVNWFEMPEFWSW